MRRALRGWIARHPATARMLAVVAITAFSGLGEWLTGYGSKALTAAFFMFCGLIFGMALGERGRQHV
jgi:hypothetical protein